jgi:hypothetical protein
MERLNYKEIVQKILESHVKNRSNSQTEVKLIFDTERDRFCVGRSAIAGRVLVEHFKEFERGCEVSEEGTQLQPQLADAWFRRGRVLALAGKHREAVEVLEKGCISWERYRLMKVL